MLYDNLLNMAVGTTLQWNQQRATSSALWGFLVLTVSGEADAIFRGQGDERIRRLEEIGTVHRTRQANTIRNYFPRDESSPPNAN